ncbi:porin family protein [Tamlana haliotis]|uniref:Porin family protein n=1 Tax=Pseudotamlana haliotis TaxID=2614804 RepID=A0A6N6MMT0_9FLAO|nr:outer membrane beta-barrel protein [Tamlana haliotis]KAB1070353.1 porin family protein [Tamlana haliotis]
MKKITLLILFLALIPMQKALAQNFEITASYGAQFGAKLNFPDGYLKVENSGQLGVSLGMEIRPNVVGEISYFRHESELRDVYYNRPNLNTSSDLNMDWLLLGANHYFGKSQIIKPFLGGGLGVVFVSPEYDENSTRFTFFFKGGANFMLTDRFGLNVQGNLFLPIQYEGFYIGTGGSGVSTQSTIALAGISAGIVFKLGA